MSRQLTITGYSTALFSTWYFVSEYGILFDCGDGVSSALLQKSRKVKHVFISHADRDHLAGLLQFNQLNARPELKIYYPKDCRSFPALAEFCAKFDPQVSGTQWIPIDSGTEIPIRSDLSVRAVENTHVPTDGTATKSLSYFVDAISRKLKLQFSGLTGAEIAAAREQYGNAGITDESRCSKLCYSGDTPIEIDGRYDDTETLIHEATFLTDVEIEPNNPKRNKHSSLEQVMRMVANSNIQQLIPGHFSTRYSNKQIRDAVADRIAHHEIEIPVHIVYPSAISHDILK